MQTQGGDGLTIREMCESARVSRASYYRSWQKQEPKQEELALRDAIQRLALKDRHCGYRRIGRWLRREGWGVNHKRVLRLMREDNLLSIRRRRFVVTTDSTHSWRVYPNLARRMVLSAINQLWVADITYVRLQQEFIYLAVILDVYSRRVVGWSISRHLDSSIAQQALEVALKERQPEPGLIHRGAGKGGKAHTPKPRDYTQAMPRQMRRAALRSALSVKAADSQIIVLEDLNLDGGQAKTQAMAQVLAGLLGEGQTALVLLPAKNEAVEHSLRNLERAKYLRANYLNIRDLLGYDMVLLPVGALEVIEGYLG